MLVAAKIFRQEFFKEINRMLTIHKRTTVIIIALPIIYTSLFGALFYKNSLTEVPIIICNYDDGAYGRKIIKDLQSTPDISILEKITNDTDIKEKMLHKNAAGAVIIPADFSKNIITGKSSTIEVVINNANTVMGNTATKAIQQVLSTNEAEFTVRQRLSRGWDAGMAGGGLTLNTRIIGNPTGGYEDFFLLALVLHAMQIGCVFSIAPSLSLEKKRRGQKLFRHAKECLAAKLSAYTLLAGSVSGFCLIICLNLFSLNSKGNFLPVLIIISLFISAVVAFALFVGSWTNKADKAITNALFYIMPSMLFTGAVWPLYSMDSISYFISRILPITYAAGDLRSFMLLGESAGWEMHSLILGCFTVFFYLLANAGLQYKVRSREKC